MKKLTLLILPIIMLAACNPHSPRRYKSYSGIDYSAYETTATAEIQEPAEEINQENFDTSAVEEITEEEIIESSSQAYGEAVVVMSSKKISLGKKATSEDLGTFQIALDNSYNMILKKHRTEGFTYTLSPAGTVNPLSVINVQCLLSENFANAAGKKVCDAFFAQIPIEYENEKLKKTQE
ncbi:MAG: hypothetical protein K6E94_01440 [Elusimicrobiaceae bacterium]|nr:hypothetical protein [Elusimicrobiaceae bacterium]